MTNVTISENAAAAGSGGNIYNADPGSTMTLLNVTVAVATTGDGITEAAGTVTLKNSLVVNNNADDCTNPVNTNGQNTDSDGTCGLSPAKGDTTDTTPGIDPLGNNGGQTDTHALQPNSSAIDSADNNACPSDDQRNTPRPLDGDNNAGAVCDRGAYEYAECLGATATIIGTEGDDNLTPQTTGGPDVVLALGGNDTIDGKGGNDKICGGAGNDLLIGGAGADELDGENGNDTASFSNSGSPVKVDLAAGTAISVGTGNDSLFSIENATGGSGADKLKGNSGPNLLIGGEGKDSLEGREGNDILLGEGGNDTLRPGGGNDNSDGGSGTDNLYFKVGPVTVDVRNGKATGEGNDDFSNMERYYGTPSADTFQGDDQTNRFKGRGGNDLFFGRGGDDRLTGGAGADTVDFSGNSAVIVNLREGTASGQGNDTLIDLENVIGSSRADNITGNNGPNVLRGGAAADSLQGLNGADDLFGEDGNDALDGGAGSDDCSGGPGTDTAVSCETQTEIP